MKMKTCRSLPARLYLLSLPSSVPRTQPYQQCYRTQSRQQAQWQAQSISPYGSCVVAVVARTVPAADSNQVEVAVDTAAEMAAVPASVVAVDTVCSVPEVVLAVVGMEVNYRYFEVETVAT